MTTNPPDCASVGRIRRPHGVRGELVVEVMTDAPDAHFAPGARLFRGTNEGALWQAPRSKELQQLTVKSMRPFKDGLLLMVDAIADRTEAEKWNGRHLMVPVEELSEPDEGEVFAHELVGMTLVDAESGKELGPVVEFYELPQGLLIEFKKGETLASVPFVEEFIVEVDREARVIRVALPDGLVE